MSNPSRTGMSPRPRHNQKGAAMLIFMVVAVLVASIAFLKLRSDSSQELKEREYTSDALRKAKEHLLAYALNPSFKSTPDSVGDSRLPGQFPCPDTNADGAADSDANGCVPSSTPGAPGYVGRLPYTSIDMKSVDATDGQNNMVWYAVSASYTLKPALGGKPVINSDTPANLDSTISNQVVAAVFSPGLALSGQNRDADPNDYNNYLEQLTTSTQSTTDTSVVQDVWFANGVFFPNASAPANANDRWVTITVREVQDAIQDVMIREAKSCLDAFALQSKGKYPWAAPLPTTVGASPSYKGVCGNYFGRIPYDGTENLVAPDCMPTEAETVEVSETCKRYPENATSAEICTIYQNYLNKTKAHWFDKDEHGGKDKYNDNDHCLNLKGHDCRCEMVGFAQCDYALVSTPEICDVTFETHKGPMTVLQIAQYKLTKPPCAKKQENKDLNDDQGYDKDGYDKDGYDKDGYDKDGFNNQGEDKDGKKRAAIDSDELVVAGLTLDHGSQDLLIVASNDKDDYDKDGYDKDGYDKHGYDKHGRDKDGYDKDGYDKDGFDKDGHDKDWNNDENDDEFSDDDDPEVCKDYQAVVDICNSGLTKTGGVDLDMPTTQLSDIAACQTFVNTYSTAWKDLLFYQVARKYTAGWGGDVTPTGQGDECTVDGEDTCITLGNNDKAHAVVINAGKGLSPQVRKTDAERALVDNYLDQDATHDNVTPTTKVVAPIVYSTAPPESAGFNDRVVCVDGGVNCK